MANVKYKFVQPDKIIKTGETWGIVLPDEKVNQTVLSGQTPSIIRINNGVIRLLDTDKKITERFFVSRGIATVANNECILAAENIIAFDDIDLETALKYNDDFHQMIVENIKASK